MVRRREERWMAHLSVREREREERGATLDG